MNEPTTSYGSWCNITNATGLRPEDVVTDVVGEWADDFDMEGLSKAYSDAVNEALPEGVTLHGADFIGPYPLREDLLDATREAVASVDLTPLLEKFEREPEGIA